MTVNNIVS
ncbi:hypothetical protein CGLO_13925 [Colletotrichum gloeosporioides Cg-14]|uniref:Uncharacterized protein n=1 Tax=Colletotrichum gloeosporioides (strain Cg-14) TaxID=1237896 RepID=T0LFE8_COLGC|nr:hypothetical protein CGLO_13925 [Colletotrichum gloeosporioides Cg-14]